MCTIFSQGANTSDIAQCIFLPYIFSKDKKIVLWKKYTF